MADEDPKNRREKVLFDKLKPARHRKQPPENPHEQRFNVIKGRNERRTIPEKYKKKYRGQHRKEQ